MPGPLLFFNSAMGFIDPASKNGNIFPICGFSVIDTYWRDTAKKNLNSTEKKGSFENDIVGQQRSLHHGFSWSYASQWNQKMRWYFVYTPTDFR